MTCVEDGTISLWLYEVIEAFDAIYDEGYGPAHIVIGDCNVEDHHIQWCLDQPDASDGPWRPFLVWMLTVPELERCPKMRKEA